MKKNYIKFRDWLIKTFSEDESLKTPEEKQKELKFKLEEIQEKKQRKFVFTLAMFIGVLAFLMFFLVICVEHEMTLINMAVSFSGAMIVGIAVFFEEWLCTELDESSIKKKLLKYENDTLQDKVNEDIFENSIKMSYKYLDQYYLQTREQAQKGFYTTVCISIFGALLIGAGIIMMFLNHTEPSYVTCASGVITEFIAAIFFYLYNKTITSMSKYHNKLVLSHNISIALKVAESLPDEDKVKAKDLIISELLKDINTFLIKNDFEGDKE